LEPSLDQFVYLDLLASKSSHKHVISLEGVRRHPRLYNHMWQSKSCP